MTPNQAKKIIADALKKYGLANKLTARTVNFSDLARGSCIFVKVHKWQSSPIWNELAIVANSNGFCIES